MRDSFLFSHQETNAMPTPLFSLWLPVVASGVALFFAGWLAWMILPHHKAEWKGLANEDAVMGAPRSAGVAPGQYMFPHAACSGTEEFKATMKAGPNGNLVVWPGPCSMGKNMLSTVIYFVVVSFVIAYLTAQVLAPGAEFMKVFQFVGTAGILTYGSANILNGIWFGRKIVADVVDGIAYGVITGAIFAALWPAAAVV
jgi:hypothetical protein